MAEMNIKINCAGNKSFTVENLISYEWSRDSSAACDGLRLCFESETPLAEAVSLEMKKEGELLFFGYVDLQSRSDNREFIYARSSACLLVDNEAPQLTYNSPCVNSLFALNAAPLGFVNRLKNSYTAESYTVSRGTSCYGAINNFVRMFSNKSVLVNPQGELYIPDGKVAYTVNPESILSEKRSIKRGSAVSRIDYKTDGDYVHHRESRALTRLGIKRTRHLNAAPLSELQRSRYLSRRLEEASKAYYSAEITVEGVETAELYSPVILDGYDGYYITSLVTAFSAGGETTKITLFKKLDLEEADYVA